MLPVCQQTVPVVGGRGLARIFEFVAVDIANERRDCFQ